MKLYFQTSVDNDGVFGFPVVSAVDAILASKLGGARVDHVPGTPFEFLLLDVLQ